MKEFRIYLLYFKQFLLARLSYRADFFASLVASVFISVTGILFVFVLVDGEVVKDLRGWSRDEVLFIVGYSFLATAIFSVLAPNLYQFGDKYIIQGQFDRVLLRPLSSLGQVLCETFNLESLGNLIIGGLTIALAKSHLGLTFSFLDYLWLVVSAISGGVILLSFFVILASLSFHFEDRLGISAPFFNLLNFGRYPLPIFHRAIQLLLTTVVPFGFVAFYPATHFFTKTGFEYYCYCTPIVALTTTLLAVVFWRAGESRYASVGN